MDPTLPSSQQRPTQPPPSASLADTGPVAQPSVPKTTDTTNDEQKKKNELNSVSAPSKEFGPMSASAAPSESGGQVENDDDEDEIKVARQEVMVGQKVSPVKEVPVSKELADIGVEQGADVEKEIPSVVQQAGMRPTSVDSYNPVAATASIRLPITKAHAVQLDKRSKIKESIKWLARIIVRQWERVQFFEKHKGDKLEEL